MAHPTRLTLVGLLRREGALTATQAAERLHESVAGCSFHLRQLARYGLVEPAPGGRGRERPWRATARYTRLPRVLASPEVAAAADMFGSVLAERHFETTIGWIERRHAEPREWQEAAGMGDTHLHLTAGELTRLLADIAALVAPYAERSSRPELRQEGGRHVTLLLAAIPLR